MIRPILALLPLVAASPALAQQQTQCGVTQSVVSLSPNVPAVLVNPNAQRRGIEFQNIGATAVTIAPGASVTSGQGLVLAPGTGTPPAGGSEKYFSGPVPANTFAAVSVSGTSVLVWECQ